MGASKRRNPRRMVVYDYTISFVMEEGEDQQSERQLAMKSAMAAMSVLRGKHEAMSATRRRSFPMKRKKSKKRR